MIAKMAALDWRAMKYYQIRVLLLPVTAFLIGLYLPLLTIPTSVIMFLVFSINPFAVEEKGALNNLYLTLPVKRSTVVTGRFALSLFMALCGVIIGIPVMLLADRFALSHYYLPVSWYVIILALSYLLYAFFNLAMFPILFRLGYNKGKFLGFYLPAVFLGLLYGANSFLFSSSGNGLSVMDILQYAREHMLLVSGGMALLATILLAVSYFISIRLYSKRDL
jgi:hypothetical protein